MSKIDTRPLNARALSPEPVHEERLYRLDCRYYKLNTPSERERDWAERDMKDAERPNGPVILAAFFLVVFWGVFAYALVTYLTGSVTDAVSDVAVEVAR